MSHKITQCPKCKTSFRIDEAQLAAARGKVRCGFCMNVFSALDYLIQSNPQVDPTIAAAAVEDDVSDAALDVDDDDLVFDDRGAHSNDIEAIAINPALRAPERTAAALAQTETAVDDADEVWAERLLDDLEHGPTAGAKGELADELDVLAEVADDLQVGAKELEPAQSEQQLEHQIESLDDLQNSLENRDVQQPLAEKLRAEIGDFDQSQSLEDQADPDFVVDAEYRPQAQPKKPRWPWLLGGLLLMVLLAGQYLYLNFEKLTMDSKYRPALAKMCEVLNCQLPVLKDLEQITTEQLVVRNHPDKQEALIVDVVITNQAAFTQAFPSLELTFSDLMGNAVATRQFLPAEYLRGELTGMRLMPVRTPVHLELEIVDPGAEAVNYALKLVP